MLFCSNRPIVDCTSTSSSTTSSNGAIQSGDENSSSSCEDTNNNNNNNNNNSSNSNEFESIQDETNQQSPIENEGLKAKTEPAQKKQLLKRIMYTKEFLLRIQDKPNAVSHPRDLPKFCTNVDGYWDPEKYFDLMKQVKAQAKQQQQQQEEKMKEETMNEAAHTDTKLPIQSPIAHGHQKLAKTIQELNSNTNSTIIIEQKKNSTVYEIKPTIGQSHEVIFSSVNPDNNFYVIPVPLSSVLNELKISVNNYCNKHHKVITKPNVDDLILAKSIQDGLWYRAKVLTVSESIYNVFAIDTGKKFETVSSLLLPYPVQFKNIPAFAINIGLAGVKFREPIQRHTKNDTPMCVLKEFLKRQASFTIKVLFNSSDKYIVELFNEKGVSFNSLLNPRFQTEIYGTSIAPPPVVPSSQQNMTPTTTEEN